MPGAWIGASGFVMGTDWSWHMSPEALLWWEQIVTMSTLPEHA